jgi:acetyltransferase EpsM
MKKLVIFGGSGIGMIASSIADDTGEYEVLGFLNDFIEIGSFVGKYKKIPVIGKTEDYEKYVKQDCYFFIGYVGMKNEQGVYEKITSLNIPDDRWANLIHPTAVYPRSYCKIGKGVLFAPLCQLSPDTTVSDNCILLPNSFLGHDSFMDRFSHIATNGVIGANVHLGKAVHIGSNATLREKVRIGDFSLVGAASMVLNDVPEKSIVVGNPARIIKQG